MKLFNGRCYYHPSCDAPSRDYYHPSPEDKEVKANLTAFSFWETDKIGVKVTHKDHVMSFDVSLEIAKEMRDSLDAAINHYEEMEKDSWANSNNS